MADRYRFGPPKDAIETYSDGTVVPHRMQVVQRERSDGTWETIGYVEIHLHRVRRDATDVEDVSLGFTGRVNPKR